MEKPVVVALIPTADPSTIKGKSLVRFIVWAAGVGVGVGVGTGTTITDSTSLGSSVQDVLSGDIQHCTRLTCGDITAKASMIAIASPPLSVSTQLGGGVGRISRVVPLVIVKHTCSPGPRF